MTRAQYLSVGDVSLFRVEYVRGATNLGGGSL